ncbi:SRS10 [Auxenochlorella protothecoides x Auxenochlorella symbiontica]
MAPPVYCGNYEYDASERDLERLFDRYGRVERVEFKSGFCFVHYEDIRDAEDAIKDLDGREWGRMRRRLRAEFSKTDVNVKVREERRREAAIPNTTLFVAGFDPRTIRTRDLERAFEPFGRVKRCQIKKSFCFVEFYDLEDAKEACKKVHGTRILGRDITVEFCVKDSSAGRSFSPAGGRDSRDRAPYGEDRRGRDPSRDRRPGPRSRSRSRSHSAGRRGRASPRYSRSRSPAPARRARSPLPARREDRSPAGRAARSRSRSPLRGRSRSPVRRKDASRSRSPSPL